MEILIIVVVLSILGSRKDLSLEIESLHKVKSYVENLELDHNYTKEKIRIFKDILPYLPKDYIETGGRSIIATEKILRLLETVEYVGLETKVPVEALDLAPMERSYKIVATLQEEIENSNIEKLGFVLDIMVNKDQYKMLANTALEFLSNKEALKNPKNITKLIKPFIGDKDIENSELGKLIDILDILEPGEKTNEQPSDN